jgi:hypothetical protein
MLEQHIIDWIDKLLIPQENLGNYSICPYAKAAEYEIIETDGSNINPPPWDFELIIYVLPNYYTQQELFSMAGEYNKMFPDLIFLPDHKDRNTFINGVQTNNGKYNLILCQWRDNLNKARKKLSGTAYYSYWTEEYLKEILNT